MELIPNSTFRIVSGATPHTAYTPGLYRVVLDEIRAELTIAVLIQQEGQPAKGRGGRPKKDAPKRPRKKPPAPMVGRLLWMNRSELEQLIDQGFLVPIKLQRVASAYVQPTSEAGRNLLENRIKGMSSFLDFDKLRENILVHEGLGGLVKETRQRTGWSKAVVYKLWSLLCRFGLDAMSLKPAHERCGAKGIARPVNPGGRQKAGRKTTKQRIAHAFGKVEAPEQPGVSSLWVAAILAADSQIPTPKPSWSKRCDQIVRSAFVSVAREENGQFQLVKPSLGDYPNNKQIQRVLTVDKSKLELLLEKTTKRHFNSALRGLQARNWEGVAGPGHTWAIDSTIGDIYLRSSINRHWVIGRPIVYVITDAWSTAVVGFYVCLTGPSWHTAKVSLFNSVADPTLMGELWGYQPILTLSPHPTMCFVLLCDRGEYLSLGHRETAVKLLPMTSYTPPYRGDLKGGVEVLHRIAKDAQYLFIPGAMNFRREELELKRVNPNDSVLNMREYVAWLHMCFAEYNLTADRRHRVDAHMLAAGVFPSPAGLWSWGHQMGVGFRKHNDEYDLIKNLLPCREASIGKTGVKFLGCDYSSDEVVENQWTTIARNFGSTKIDVNYYDGSMSRIWTPNHNGTGMIKLSLSDQSKITSQATIYDRLDAAAVESMKQPDIAHQNMMTKLELRDAQNRLIELAKLKHLEETDGASGKKPTISEARKMEIHKSQPNSVPDENIDSRGTKESAVIHQDMMKRLLDSLQNG